MNLWKIMCNCKLLLEMSVSQFQPLALVLSCGPTTLPRSMLFLHGRTCLLSRGQGLVLLPGSLPCSLPRPQPTLGAPQVLLGPGRGQRISCHFSPGCTVSSERSFFSILPTGCSFSILLLIIIIIHLLFITFPFMERGWNTGVAD